MGESYLLDSDFLIEHLRGIDSARAFFDQLDGDLFVSAVTVTELYSGVRHERHKQSTDRLLQTIKVIAIDEHIAKRAGLLRAQYGPRHGTSTPDALIAATAEHLEATLVSFNRRHFSMINKLLVPYER
jgi:predicted nucleic acid-binding protein